MAGSLGVALVFAVALTLGFGWDTMFRQPGRGSQEPGSGLAGPLPASPEGIPEPAGQTQDPPAQQPAADTENGDGERARGEGDPGSGARQDDADDAGDGSGSARRDVPSSRDTPATSDPGTVTDSAGSDTSTETDASTPVSSSPTEGASENGNADRPAEKPDWKPGPAENANAAVQAENWSRGEARR